DLQKYVEKRIAEGAKPATVRHEVTVFGRMFRLGVQAGMLKVVPPLPTITVRNTRTGFFSSADLARVLEHLPDDLAPAVEFSYITGMRIGEVRSLTWSQVDLMHGILRLDPETTKNREGRQWPFRLHPRLGALIRGQHERTERLQRRLGRIVPWVFWREFEPGDVRQVKEFRDSWRTACKKAGIP